MVGKPKADYVAQGLADYARRLKPYGGCELLAVRAARALKSRPSGDILDAEGKRLLQRLTPHDVVWTLDRRGKALSSEQWAKNLDQTRLQGVRRLVLVIGGPWGLSEKVLKRAHKQVSLGPPTLPHELAALVVLEQLYRAHTILAGTPYHRA